MEMLIKQIKVATNATMAKKEKLEKIQKERENVEELIQKRLKEVESEKTQLQSLTAQYFAMKSVLVVKQDVELPAARAVQKEYKGIVSGYDEQLEAAQQSVRKTKYDFQEIKVNSMVENQFSESKIKEEVTAAEKELASLKDQQCYLENLKIECERMDAANENTASLNNLLKENVDSMVENLAEVKKEFNFWSQRDAVLHQEILAVENELQQFGDDNDSSLGFKYSNDFVPASRLLTQPPSSVKKFHFRKTK